MPRSICKYLQFEKHWFKPSYPITRSQIILHTKTLNIHFQSYILAIELTYEVTDRLFQQAFYHETKKASISQPWNPEYIIAG